MTKLILKIFTKWEPEILLGFPWWVLRNRITGHVIASVNNNGHWETHNGFNSRHGQVDPDLPRDAQRELAMKTAVTAYFGDTRI